MESARGVPVFDSEGTVDSHLDTILQAGGNSERVPLLSAEAEDVDASGPGPMVPEAMANGCETARNPVQKLLSKTSTRYGTRPGRFSRFHGSTFKLIIATRLSHC